MNKERNNEIAVVMTRQRRAVFEVIQSTDGHLTASEVFEGAKKGLPGISFATVYNSLRYLKDSKLIGEISLSNGASRYDRITKRHDHALCDQCGYLVDLDLEIPEELIRQAASSSGFESRKIELTLKGLCSDCNS